MNRLARLLDTLDVAPDPGGKAAALARHLAPLSHPDRVWTLALLTGRCPRRALRAADLRDWATEAAALPPWLFDASLAVAGDIAETAAHVLPAPEAGPTPSLADTMAQIAAIAALPTEARKPATLALWATLPAPARVLANRLLTGTFRAALPPGLVARALAEVTGTDPEALALRLVAPWDPATTTLADLTAAPAGAILRRPRMAALRPMPDRPDALGRPEDWFAVWHLGGLRVQTTCHAGGWHLWSEDHEPMTARFPDLAPLGRLLPDGTVIDGEIVVLDPASGLPQPLAALQARSARKSLTARRLAEAPALLIAHDLIEPAGAGQGGLPFAARRARLDRLCAALPPGAPLRAAERVTASDWTGRAQVLAQVRALRAQALWLTRLDAPDAGAGAVAGGDAGIIEWRPPPLSVTAVLIHAEAVQGAGPFAAFTFALRDGADLVPVAKTAAGLTPADRTDLSAWVRANTLERFGPVRRVRPDLVFDIGFAGATPAPRRKSGLMLSDPHIRQWHRDRSAADIDTLDTLRALIAPGNPP